jgi:SAM-dependent methyltransferase
MLGTSEGGSRNVEPAATLPDTGAAPTTSSGLETLSHKYVGFEDAFRGSQEDIQRQLRDYVPIFAGASDVLDIGCGRGEFLALLRESGVSARGIDLNDAMVAVCREKGLEATKADALSYLRGVPSGSLGGLFAAQVVEHLEPAYLTRLLEAAFAALRPGSPIVLETINPACWFAFFESYIRDITHVRPLHPDTLKFLLIASGFQQIEIRYRAPYPEHEKLQGLPASAALGDSVDTINANVEKINRLLFTHLDYAAIGKRS